jgi:hypothetical protein
MLKKKVFPKGAYRTEVPYWKNHGTQCSAKHSGAFSEQGSKSGSTTTARGRFDQTTRILFTKKKQNASTVQPLLSANRHHSSNSYNMTGG